MFPQKPSIWLKHSSLTNISPNQTASFVEYLRWMRVRSSNKTENSGTVLELFEKFEDNDFSEALERFTNRTKKLADFSFKVTCPWRIRVGGAKGPESMLLPAFDNLGMPYIPSSTLRGVAREIARQDKNTTDAEVKEIFGDIDSNDSKMGQVVFLDAYPLPEEDMQGGLNPDMANSIWKWEKKDRLAQYDGDLLPQYNTEPNPCISLWKPTFLIGLKKTEKCEERIFEDVKYWLIKGLDLGIGSRVNSGYGTLQIQDKKLKQEVIDNKVITKKSIVNIRFELKGQLIHGRQTFNRWEMNNNNTNWKPPGIAEDELRPVAFRSMMRYWFRALGLGVLEPKLVRELELKIFGGIKPEPSTGLFRIEVTGNEEREMSREAPGLMTGRLIIRRSYLSETLPNNKRNALIGLLKTLTWLMLHLGGVGQGARRPCYRRKGSNPPWRGVTLEVVQNPKRRDDYWETPQSLDVLQTIFVARFKEFYKYLKGFISQPIDWNQLKTVAIANDWEEVIDSNCEILICQGIQQGNKSFALSELHSQTFKIEYRDKKGNSRYKYDPQLCGAVKPTTIPSPVWIKHIDYLEEMNFQVVTVFGAKIGKRKQFIDKLKDSKKDRNRCLQIFPIKS